MCVGVEEETEGEGGKRRLNEEGMHGRMRERPLTSSVCTSRLLCLSSITGLILREETSSCCTDVFTGRKRETTRVVISRYIVCVHSKQIKCETVGI